MENEGVPALRRLRFASPPVMQFTPLAGLRAKNKNSTDRLPEIFSDFSRCMSEKYI
ncbi:MAG: hypothetical protein LBE12_14480 [Planctomycetaceae bacterium]|nr:hypothetical protein [Planctomycetaceae bacterium]